MASSKGKKYSPILSMQVAYLLTVCFALVAAILAVYGSILLVLLHTPTLLLTLFGAGASLGLPWLFGRRITSIWDTNTEGFSKDHPSKFMELAVGVRNTAPYVQVLTIVLAASAVGYLHPNPTLFSVIGDTLLEFFLMELVLIFTVLALWHPSSHFALLASLDSDKDPERRPHQIFLDHTLDFFNLVLRSTRSVARVKNNLNLEILLFDADQFFRRLWISRLLSAERDRDENRFISDLAEIAQKQVSEILDRSGWRWWIRVHEKEIMESLLTVLGIVVPLWPTISPPLHQLASQSLQQFLQSWSHLL